MTTPADTVALWTTLFRLKTTPRTGWVDRGIPVEQAESVADHSFFSSLLAWVVAHDDASLDADRVLQLALIHDVAEAISGDLPPYDPEDIPADASERWAFFGQRRQRSAENAARKRALEDDAAERILAMLPETVRESWRLLWDEYEAQQSPEALLVKQIDRLELFIQSRLYAQVYPDVPVHGFVEMAREGITHPLLVSLRDAFLETGEM